MSLDLLVIGAHPELAPDSTQSAPEPAWVCGNDEVTR